MWPAQCFGAFAPVCWLNNGLLINLLAALLQCCTHLCRFNLNSFFMESATTALAAEAEIRELIDDKMAAIYNRDEHAVLKSVRRQRNNLRPCPAAAK
jgi:hypothetical protein